MKIEIKKGAIVTVLCDGSAPTLDKSCGPTLKGSAGTVMQPAQFLRAAFGKTINRQNEQESFNLSVTRECSSYEIGLFWLLDHLKDCLKDGSIVFTPEEGDATGTRTIADAGIEGIAFDQIGATLFLTYTITGGSIS